MYGCCTPVFVLVPHGSHVISEAEEIIRTMMPPEFRDAIQAEDVLKEPIGPCTDLDLRGLGGQIGLGPLPVNTHVSNKPEVLAFGLRRGAAVSPARRDRHQKACTCSATSWVITF